MKRAQPTALGVFGHAERRAVKARSMTRAEWHGLTRRLRALVRGSACGDSRLRERAISLTLELEALSRCCVGWRHLGGPGQWRLKDVLEVRQLCLGDRHDGVVDCCGIEGALRVQLAAQWYPARSAA